MEYSQVSVQGNVSKKDKGLIMETSTSTSKTSVIEISSDEENIRDSRTSLVNGRSDEDYDIVLLSGNEPSKCIDKIMDCDKAKTRKYPYLRSALLHGRFPTEKNAPDLTTNGSFLEDSQDAQAKIAVSHRSVSSMSITSSVVGNKLVASERQFADALKQDAIAFKKGIVPDSLRSVHHRARTRSQDNKSFVNTLRSHTVAGDLKRNNTSLCSSQDEKKNRREKLIERQNAEPADIQNMTLFHHHPKTTAKTRGKRVRPVSHYFTSDDNQTAQPRQKRKLGNLKTERKHEEQGKTKRKKRQFDTNSADTTHLHGSLLPSNFISAEKFNTHRNVTDCSGPQNLLRAPPLSSDTSLGATSIVAELPQWWQGIDKDTDVMRQNFTEEVRDSPSNSGKTKRKKGQFDANSADTTHGSLLAANFIRAEKFNAHRNCADCSGTQNLLKASTLSSDTSLGATSIVAELPRWWQGIDKDTDSMRQCFTDKVQDSPSNSGTRGKGKKRNRRKANEETNVEILVPANGPPNSDNLQSDQDVMRELYVCKWTDTQQTSLLGDKLQSPSLTCTGMFVNRAAFSVQSNTPVEKTPSKSKTPEVHVSDEMPANDIHVLQSERYGAANAWRISACRIGDTQKSGGMGNTQESVAKDCQTYSHSSRKMQKGDDKDLVSYSTPVQITPFDQTHQHHLQENYIKLSTTHKNGQVLVEDMHSLPSEQAHRGITSEPCGDENAYDDPPLRLSKSASEKTEENIVFAEAFNIRPNADFLEGTEISLPFGQETFNYNPLQNVPVQQESISTILMWPTLAELSLTDPASSTPVEAGLLQNPGNLASTQFAAVGMSSAQMIPVEPRPRKVHSNMFPFPASSNAYLVPETSNSYPFPAHSIVFSAHSNAYALPAPEFFFPARQRNTFDI